MPTTPINSTTNSTTAAALQSNSATKPAQLSNTEINQRQLNVAILQSQQDVNIGAKDQPQSLVLKAAIDSINEQIAPYLGEDSLATALNEEVDVSPEATASRIVSQATGFFSSFQQNNETLGFDQQLEKFLQVIGGGIDQGFGEARDILDSLQVLEGDVASNIDKTYDLVQAGLEAFNEQQSSNA